MVSLRRFLKSQSRRRSPVFCSSALRMKALQRHARHLQRVLEGEEDAAFSALIDRQGGDVLAVKYDAAARHGVDRIAGDGVAERGFSRAVRPHENVRLVAPDREVNAVKDLLFPRADVQAIDL